LEAVRVRVKSWIRCGITVKIQKLKRLKMKTLTPTVEARKAKLEPWRVCRQEVTDEE
jgi:hypothetical protein